jgi:hypothetical protein
MDHNEGTVPRLDPVAGIWDSSKEAEITQLVAISAAIGPSALFG